MATKRKTMILRKGEIIDVSEYYDGNYGAPGMPRLKKKKPTKEQMVQVNLLNKARVCRLKMLEYINYGDFFATWTYREVCRPPDMETALKHFQKAIRKVKQFFRKQSQECYWFRNIEQGTRGAWHIHLVIKNIEGADSVIRKAWTHGGTYIVEIRESKFYSEDFTKLANYMTKDENTIFHKKDGTVAKTKIKQANYNSSRNMPLPEPHIDKLQRWKKEIKPKKGYYVASMFEGINPVTGFKYRRYTMLRIRGDDKHVRSEYIP